MFEIQEAKVTENGPSNCRMLSSDGVLNIVTKLISNGDKFFRRNADDIPFRLELFFRCLCAGLRLYCASGMKAGSLSPEPLRGLNDPMKKLRMFHLNQVDWDKKQKQRKRYKVRNYDNEFLIVYVWDLIYSIPMQRTLMENVKARIISAGAATVHLVLFSIWVRSLTYCVVDQKPGIGHKGNW